MRKMLVVAVREYLAAVRTKAFIVSLVIMPILMSGSILVQWLLRDFHDTQKKTFAVVDRTKSERIYPLIDAAVRDYNEKETRDPQTGKQIQPLFELKRERPSEANERAISEQRAELSERVHKGELFGFLDIGADVLHPEAAGANADSRIIRYQSNRPTNAALPRLLQKDVVERISALRYQDANLPVPLARLQEIMQPAKVDVKGLSRRIPGTGQIEDASSRSLIAPVAVPIGLMMLMFMVVMMSSTPLMQGVVEEKMQRIAEVLLGSVRPFDLMFGKLMGMTAVSLTIAAVYLGGAYWAAQHYGFEKYVSGQLLAWFLVYQTLAALMFGSLFIAIGAACTDMKETQNLLWPVMLLIVMPMFVLGSVLQEPNSTVATALSFFPFATPMLMIMRQSVPPGVPVWQPIVGVILVLLTTLFCVWAGGRIFRIGILLQGKGARLGEMLHWVFRG